MCLLQRITIKNFIEILDDEYFTDVSVIIFSLIIINS